MKSINKSIQKIYPWYTTLGQYQGGQANPELYPIFFLLSFVFLALLLFLYTYQEYIFLTLQIRLFIFKCDIRIFHRIQCSQCSSQIFHSEQCHSGITLAPQRIKEKMSSSNIMAKVQRNPARDQLISHLIFKDALLRIYRIKLYIKEKSR